ncbi:hypothetical protein HK096_001719 [Nowakowskiella sp. JEL0078]|nr:hypothetical protein HK096_001719 [Nowakowskiella sp. JEL0078]
MPEYKRITPFEEAKILESRVKPKRSNLTISGAKAFSIQNFFSPEECDYYVSESLKLSFESIEWEYKKTYRDCVRVVAKSEQMGISLWNRLLPYLSLDDIEEVRPFGFGATKGTWAPVGVNPMIRFSQYNPGGHFAIHRDGGFVIHDDLRSIFTILIFLNEGFEGGETIFYSDEVNDQNSPLTFVPTKGTALVFNHDCRHEGKTLISGSKFILRTDIMFERIDTPFAKGSILDQQYANIPEYQEAERLYQHSIELQKSGDPEV